MRTICNIKSALSRYKVTIIIIYNGFSSTRRKETSHFNSEKRRATKAGVSRPAIRGRAGRYAKLVGIHHINKNSVQLPRPRTQSEGRTRGIIITTPLPPNKARFPLQRKTQRRHLFPTSAARPNYPCQRSQTYHPPASKPTCLALRNASSATARTVRRHPCSAFRAACSKPLRTPLGEPSWSGRS